MTCEPDDFSAKQHEEKLKIFVDIQQSEAGLNCSRNNYFLIVASILILALSQFNNPVFVSFISLLGLALSAAWLLIQYRSSQYMRYWKDEAQKISKTGNLPYIYPDSVKGIEMRRILYILPFSFLIFWLAIFLISVIYPSFISALIVNACHSKV